MTTEERICRSLKALGSILDTVDDCRRAAGWALGRRDLSRLALELDEIRLAASEGAACAREVARG